MPVPLRYCSPTGPPPARRWRRRSDCRAKRRRAVITWLREYEDSPHTFANYPKKPSGYCCGAASVGKTLAGLGREDILGLPALLASPQPAERWIGPARASTQTGKPFTGPLAPSSIRQALTILGALFRICWTPAICAATRWPGAPAKTRPQPPGVERYLDAELWQGGARHAGGTAAQRYARDLITSGRAGCFICFI